MPSIPLAYSKRPHPFLPLPQAPPCFATHTQRCETGYATCINTTFLLYVFVARSKHVLFKEYELSTILTAFVEGYL